MPDEKNAPREDDSMPDTYDLMAALSDGHLGFEVTFNPAPERGNAPADAKPVTVVLMLVSADTLHKEMVERGILATHRLSAIRPVRVTA